LIGPSLALIIVKYDEDFIEFGAPHSLATAGRTIHIQFNP
jgi:hypothetical protein